MPDPSYDSEVALAQALIRVFSPSGHESAASTVLLEAFRALRYDEAYRDAAGNVVGILECGEGPLVHLNGHLDVVPPGDEGLWPHEPFGAEIADGRLWGRGACDMKSALACMAFAARDAADAGFQGTIAVSGVVQEEVGGLGARYLGETGFGGRRPDVAVVGEPSRLRLMMGHRGRVELELVFHGRIAHAAKSELGENALYLAAEGLERLRAMPLPSGGAFGASSVTPTNLESFPRGGRNVVPGRAVVTLDYRNVPGDEPDEVVDRIRALLPEVTVRVPTEQAVSEGGAVKYETPKVARAYRTPEADRWVKTARSALRESLERQGLAYAEDVWWFATDAPHLAAGGVPVIGFGPGEESLAHTTRESVPLEHLAAARVAYADLCVGFGRAGVSFMAEGSAAAEGGIG